MNAQTQALWAYKYQLERSILANEQLVQQMPAESDIVRAIIRRIARTEQLLNDVDRKLKQIGAMGP